MYVPAKRFSFICIIVTHTVVFAFNIVLLALGLASHFTIIRLLTDIGRVETCLDAFVLLADIIRINCWNILLKYIPTVQLGFTFNVTKRAHLCLVNGVYRCNLKFCITTNILKCLLKRVKEMYNILMAWYMPNFNAYI